MIGWLSYAPESGKWRPARLPGYVNLDKIFGWKWESGLPAFADNSVECVTSSHTLMYVEERHWPFIHREVYRVLVPGGIWRITEDNMDAEQPRKVEGRVTKTSPLHSRLYLESAKFTVRDCGVWETHFKDVTICQNNYAGLCVPYWIEGIKKHAGLHQPTQLLVSKECPFETSPAA